MLRNIGFFMFNDKRSKRVIFVAHCVLNQNAKIDRCAHYPGAMRELAGFLVESGAGIVQLPCPELLHLGLDRQAHTLPANTVESEDTRVAFRMRESTAMAICTRIADDIVYQVRQYREQGFEVVGIIGINGSPTCGVETNWYAGEEASGQGVFIRLLDERLASHGGQIPMRGVKAAAPQQAVAVAAELLTLNIGPKAT